MLLSLLFSHGTSILVVCESSILKLFLHFSESKACHVALLGGLIVLLSQRKGSEDALWESFSSGGATVMETGPQTNNQCSREFFF